MVQLQDKPPALTSDDWALICQLLEAKQRELLYEIRHTDKRIFREALRMRLQQVDNLIRRVSTGGPPE